MTNLVTRNPLHLFQENMCCFFLPNTVAAAKIDGVPVLWLNEYTNLSKEQEKFVQRARELAYHVPWIVITNLEIDQTQLDNDDSISQQLIANGGRLQIQDLDFDTTSKSLVRRACELLVNIHIGIIFVKNIVESAAPACWVIEDRPGIKWHKVAQQLVGTRIVSIPSVTNLKDLCETKELTVTIKAAVTLCLGTDVVRQAYNWTPLRDPALFNVYTAIKASQHVKGYKLLERFNISRLLNPKSYGSGGKSLLADQHPNYWKVLIDYFDSGTNLAASRRETTAIYKDHRLSLGGAQAYLTHHAISVSPSTIARSLQPARLGSISSHLHHHNYLEIRMNKPTKDSDTNSRIDSHYCNSQVFNFRELWKAVEGTTISIDDKSQIKTGVAAVQRQQRGWGTSSVPCHDFCKKADCLTATARLILDAQDSKLAARNSGQVLYTIKISKLSPSSPIQHLSDQLLLIDRHPQYFMKNGKLST